MEKFRFFCLQKIEVGNNCEKTPRRLCWQYITQYQAGNLMEIIVDKDKKLVEVWLVRIESATPETEAALKLIYDEYSKGSSRRWCSVPEAAI